FKSNSNYGRGCCDQAIDEFAIYDVPACMNPTLVTASASSVTTGTVSWTASTSDPSEGYQVYYSTSSTAPTSGTTPSETVAAGITSLNLTGLTAGSTYYIWVRSDCGDSNLSPWAGPASLYLGYCTPSTVSVDDQGITNVTFGFTPNIVNNTTGNESGSGYYGNYSAMIGDLPAGITSTVSVTFNTLTYDYYTRVWIDFNNDLDFVDAGEQVYAGTSASTSPNTLAITFIIPESVSLGNHRMRIGAGDMTVPTPCMTGNSYMCFEDYTVNVTEPPACLPPANITASTVSDVYTNISWTAPSNLPSEGYEVYYSTSPAAPDGSTPASADIANTELSYQITGLTASTTYYVWMRSECSTGSYSDWSTVTTFTTTGCDVADVCAFTFNLTDSYGDGWNDNNIDIVQNGVIIQNLTLASGSSSTVNVSMCSGLPTQIVFHIGDYIGEVSFNIVAPWGETLYSGSGFTTASDNVAVFSWVTACSPPTCPNPSGTVALNITQNSAEINWAENGDATLWDIVYGLPGFNPLTEGTLVSDLTTTAYLIDGVLNASTTYQVYVRANCGGGDYSDWVGPYDFSTACDVITSLPWTENFDLMPSIGTSIVPTCWVATSGSGTPWASANAASNTYNDPFSAPNYITVNWSPTATDKYLVTPGFALTAGQSYDFSFKYVGDGYTGWTADVRYNTAQSGTGSTMLGTAFQASGTAAATSYSNIMRTFVAPTTGIYYFMVHVNNNITPYYLGFDNFRLELSPTCLPVSSVTASLVTNHTATVSWVANGAATTWNLIYGPNGFNPLTEGTLVEGITATSYQITGLSPTTQYQVYVQGDCGAGDLSIWSDPVSFTTLVACPAIVSTSLTDATYESLTIEIDAAGTETEWNVVYGLHGFVVGEGTAIVVTENPFTISGLIPETEYDFYIQANCGADGNSTFSSVISYSTTELCPDVWAVTGTNITTEGAQVAWSHSSAQDTWNIEVGLPGFIPGTGAAVLTFTGVTENPYIITTGLTPETNYTAYVMADCGANGSSGWIGSATFTTLPTCLVPVSVTMSAVTSGSATVSWTEAGTATTWNVLYGPFGFNPLTEGTLVEGITSTSYIIEGLDDATQYSVYVQADCGGGDLSNWTTVTSFYTQCGIIDEFTWLEEFTVWSDITQCWDLTGGTRTVAQYGGTAVRANYWSWSSGNTAYLKTPLIDKSSLTNPKLEFYWSHLYSSSYPNDKLTVQVSDDNGATWTDVWMLTGAIFNSADGATNTTPGTYISSGVIDLSSFGNNIYVRFYFLSGWGPDVFINNVSIYNLVCDAPADLAVASVDNNSAIVSWTDVSGEGEADIIYGAVGFDPLTEGTVVDNVSNPYTLTNLNPETAYDVYVRSVCELAGESIWTGPVSFTTLADCPQPTNLNAVAGSPTTAVVSWSDNSGEGTADVLYGAQGFDPATQGTLVSDATNPYTITGLSPETTYDVYVHSVCALTGESLWTGPFTFTTPAVLNDEADILSYTFGAGVDYSPATIDNMAKTVHLYVVEGTSLNNLIATFTLSTGASAMVAAVPQVSGTTANNFASGPLTYVVTAEDGTTTNNWIVTVEVWVGIGQANQFAMQVLPNPNNGRFTLYINHTSDKCRYELTDVTGRILVSKQLEGKGQISENFDLNLAPGSYYLRVISGNKVKTQKLIIE
ncbi:MAG TPA: fibronectin type III domain-containing protein, partial [Bacteroidales bacterium]|nr:fibronectin type III domain-containing protein [Bacteroidales bacterium]